MDSPVTVSHYFIYFPDIGNVSLKQMLTSGWWIQVAWLVKTIFFSIFHILLTFKAYRKFIFTTNPLFWLLETDLLASGKHFVPIPQISILLEAVFPSCGKILNPWLVPVARQIFCLMGRIFFHSYFLWNHYWQCREDNIKKNFFLLVETIFFNFFRHWFKWKQSSGPTNPLLWLMKTIFG